MTDSSGRQELCSSLIVKVLIKIQSIACIYQKEKNRENISSHASDSNLNLKHSFTLVDSSLGNSHSLVARPTSDLGVPSLICGAHGSRCSSGAVQGSHPEGLKLESWWAPCLRHHFQPQPAALTSNNSLPAGLRTRCSNDILKAPRRSPIHPILWQRNCISRRLPSLQSK